MKRFVVIAVLALGATAFAGDKEGRFYQKGTIAEMSSVECGLDENSGKGLVGSIVGTDNAHKKTRSMLCPEYMVKTERVIYRIRPREEKNPALLPVGETAEFRMKKDRMVLRVREGDDKEREYTVVSATMTAAAAEKLSATNAK